MLGSFLFSDEAVPDVIACQIANVHLLDAIRALAFIEDKSSRLLRPVDYKNLDSDELGSIYESLLELHPNLNADSRTFALSTAGGNERKTTGSYYTPTSLINALLDSALNPVIESALRPPTPSSNTESIREMATRVMRDVARDLRQRQTPAEEMMWEALRKNRLGGLNFRRQHPVANTSYVADFFCYQANLIIELDGEIHQRQQAADAQRQADLEALGYRVMRFPNERIYNDLENVLTEILSVAHVPPADPRLAKSSLQVPPADPRLAKSSLQVPPADPRLAKSSLQVPPPEGEGFRVGAESALLALKICDPACGSGHFLISAAHRVAKALAQVRTGEDEPAPDATRHALRDVISHCIYGVDINPMAVELCKVALWLESLEPGKPLSFLDHRIQVGNSLLGTTPKLMAGGIPDEAFNPIEGDDPRFASALKKQNKQERGLRQAGLRQHDLFELAPAVNNRALSDAAAWIDRAPADTYAQIRVKEGLHQKFLNDAEYQKARLLADAWCAAFVWDKRPSDIPAITDALYDRMERDSKAADLQPVSTTVARLANQYRFFHWHISFPDVFRVPDSLADADNAQTGWHGGFDCVLGNPPWERIKIQEKEWFAQRDPEIANAPNAARRRALINDLGKTGHLGRAESERALLAAFKADLRAAEGESQFVRVSERFPLTGRGDVNTYALFAELNRQLMSESGRVGCIIPSGIATDDTTKFYFQSIMEDRSLVSLYDFENRENIFDGIGHGRFKFCLLTLAGSSWNIEAAKFIFFALRVEHLKDEDREFTLSAEDVALLNPNTRTGVVFRSKRDAELTKAIYRRVPVLIKEGNPEENPWGISFLRMFDMSNDSHLFRTREQLQREGYQLVGNRFMNDKSIYLPLYEAKMFHQFDHRWATYDSDEVRDMSDDEKRDPQCLSLPRYWVEKSFITTSLKDHEYSNWLLTFRKTARSTDERTVISSFLPIIAVGDRAILIMFQELQLQMSVLMGSNLNTFVFDFVARQKLGATDISHFYFKQFPIIPPDVYPSDLFKFILSRVIELTYTASDMQPIARELGYEGAPFVWDEERRFIMRCELDALYFHLYQITRADVDYIMETFPIVKRKDEAAYGEFRTKRVILAKYDEMAKQKIYS